MERMATYNEKSETPSAYISALTFISHALEVAQGATYVGASTAV
jgi:hypothetical protein